MHERERLTTTFGILLAGLIRAEEEATESERNPSTTSQSGVYPLGQALAEALVDEAIEHVAAETAESKPEQECWNFRAPAETAPR